MALSNRTAIELGRMCVVARRMLVETDTHPVPVRIVVEHLHESPTTTNHLGRGTHRDIHPRPSRSGQSPTIAPPLERRRAFIPFHLALFDPSTNPWTNSKSAAPHCLFCQSRPGTPALLGRPPDTNRRLAWIAALADLPIGERDGQELLSSR